MSTSGRPSRTFRHAKAQLLGILGRVREIMGELSEEERKRLIDYLIVKPLTPGGYTILPIDLWADVLRGLSSACKGRAYQWEWQQEVEEKLENALSKLKTFRNCEEKMRSFG